MVWLFEERERADAALAEVLKQSYEDRQLSTQQALAEFERLAQQIVEAGSERQALGLSANALSTPRSGPSGPSWRPSRRARSTRSSRASRITAGTSSRRRRCGRSSTMPCGRS